VIENVTVEETTERTETTETEEEMTGTETEKEDLKQTMFALIAERPATGM
jgi:hypothetical protein